MTLGQFDALVERLSYRHELEEYRIAKLCAVTANANRRSKKAKSFKIADFLPKKEVSQKMLLQKAEMFNMVFGGLDKRKN